MYVTACNVLGGWLKVHTRVFFRHPICQLEDLEKSTYNSPIFIKIGKYDQQGAGYSV
jgi:hypothetical protein